MTRINQVAQLYRDVIMAHAQAPAGFGLTIEATHAAARNNPLCGDDITLRLRVEGDRIRAAAFDGRACAICMASASLLCRHLPGRPATEIESSLAGFRTGLAAADGQGCPDFLAPMLGVRDYPARIACATLPWEAAAAALK